MVMSDKKIVEEISDIVEESREFYSSLSPREKSLINVCREGYQGKYDRFIKYLKQQCTRIKNLPRTVTNLYCDIESLRRIKNFEKKYKINLYLLGPLN